MPIAAEKKQRQNTYSKAPQQRDKIHTVEHYNKVPMKRILDAAKHVIEINNITIKLNRMQSINVTPKNKSLNMLVGELVDYQWKSLMIRVNQHRYKTHGKDENKIKVNCHALNCNALD